MASHYGIDLDTYNDQQTKLKQLQEANKAMVKQKAVLQGAIETNSKKFEAEISGKKKEYESLEYAKAKIVHEYNSKITILRAKGTEIQDLIEKVRANNQSDRELKGILTKWEEANLKLFEKHPIDKPEDLEILEQAQEELHIMKQMEKSKKAQKSELDETATQKEEHLKDLEVKQYLRKIRERERQGGHSLS